MIMQDFKDMPKYEEKPTKIRWAFGLFIGAAFLVVLGFYATWGG